MANGVPQLYNPDKDTGVHVPRTQEGPMAPSLVGRTMLAPKKVREAMAAAEAAQAEPTDALAYAAQQAEAEAAEATAGNLSRSLAPGDAQRLDLIGQGTTDIDAQKQLFGMAGETNPGYRVGNGMYAPTQRYAARTYDAQSRGRSGAEEEQLAQFEHDASVAYEMDREVARIAAEQDAIEAAEQVRRQRQLDQVEAMKVAAKTHERAVKAMLDAPEEDPSRTWKNMGAGRQFLFAITAGFLGMDQNEREPNKYLMRAIDRDIDAQRQNFAKKGAAAGEARQGFSMQESIFDSIMQQTGDERAASLIYKGARLEEGRSRMIALSKKMGLDVLSAQQKQQLADIDQKIANNTLQVEELVAKNPEFFWRGGGLRYNKHQQKMLLEMSKQRGDAMLKAREQSGAVSVEQAKQSSKQAVAATRATTGDPTAGMSVAERRLFQSDLHNFGTKVAPAREVLRVVDDFLKIYEETGDIAGRGADTYWDAEGQLTKTMQDKLITQIAKMQSGLTLTEREVQLYQDMVTRGWGVDSFINNMRELQRSIHEKIGNAARETSGPVAAYYSRTHPDMMPALAPDIRGLGGADDLPTILELDHEYEGEEEE